MTAPARRKIAILGGGMGALTAAYELTEVPNWQEQYEITVYQMGWRLGGKGASGRNRNVYDRIEEHGLHLWFGYYENAFHLIRRCYAALGRAPGEPLATWQEAFHKQSLFVTGEFYDGQWTQWPLVAPETPEEPGDGKIPPLWELLDRVLDFLHRHFEEHAPEELRVAAHERTTRWTWLSQLVEKLELGVSHLAASVVPLHAARALLRSIADGPSDSRAAESLDHLLRCLEAFITHVREAIASLIGGVLEHEIAKHPDLRRLLEILEIGYVNVKGIIADHVMTAGFDPLDKYDYREWMANHGASSLALNSDLVRVAYETIFAYRSGFYGQPDLGAGTAIRGLMRLCFAYKGAIAWKMQAGMGDTIFAPLYLVLKQRGVRFEFFSKVKNLGLSSDGKSIATITIAKQVTLKDGYDPLYPVNGLPCWPSEPFYDQIKEAPELERLQIDLESNWSPWKDVENPPPLVCGKDFTDVVLGISIGALHEICGELLSMPAWKQMVSDVEAVPTQAFQLWLKPDLAALGWNVKVKDELVPPILGGFAQPQNTWADMSHLIAREAWPSGKKPGGISYFCGPFAADVMLRPLSTDYGYPLEQNQRVMERALQWLASNAASIWPLSIGPGYPGGFRDVFDLDKLVDLSQLLGDAPVHFQAQYWRANIDPSELYVLSVRGSLFSRLRPGSSGFANLFLAGDWTRNDLNYGCIEAAVMSGRQAARAISGYPKVVFGEEDQTGLANVTLSQVDHGSPTIVSRA